VSSFSADEGDFITVHQHNELSQNLSFYSMSNLELIFLQITYLEIQEKSELHISI